MLQLLPPEIIHIIFRKIPRESITNLLTAIPHIEHVYFDMIRATPIENNIVEIGVYTGLVDAAISGEYADFCRIYYRVISAEINIENITVIPLQQMADLMMIAKANNSLGGQLIQRLLFRKPLRSFTRMIHIINAPQIIDWRVLVPHTTHFAHFAAAHIARIYANNAEPHEVAQRLFNESDKYTVMRVMTLSRTCHYSTENWQHESGTFNLVFLRYYYHLITPDIMSQILIQGYISSIESLIIIVYCEDNPQEILRIIREITLPETRKFILQTMRRFRRDNAMAYVMSNMDQLTDLVPDTITSINEEFFQIAYFDDVSRLQTLFELLIRITPLRIEFLQNIYDYSAVNCQNAIAQIKQRFPEYIPENIDYPDLDFLKTDVEKLAIIRNTADDCGNIRIADLAISVCV